MITPLPTGITPYPEHQVALILHLLGPAAIVLGAGIVLVTVVQARRGRSADTTPHRQARERAAFGIGSTAIAVGAVVLWASGGMS